MSEFKKLADEYLMNEDLGYGSGIVPSGNPYMAGQLGVYNSPETSNKYRSYKNYNMTSNNTVVSSGYYDTVFDADIRKIMALLKDLGFEVEWPKNDNGEKEFHLANVKSHDHTHTQTSQTDIGSSDDVMNDTSGVNMSKDLLMKHLKAEFGDDLYKKAKDAPPISYDNIMLGLKDVMSDLKYPDKDYATIRVLVQLVKDPNYYSGLKKYDIHEERDIYGTTFKPTEIKNILEDLK
jgi:hypothetical protein